MSSESTSASAIFLDTTILVALRAHSPSVRQIIKQRLEQFGIRATCDVAIQEFKRRFLGDVRYVRSLFQRYGSVTEVLRHINEVLPEFHRRKAKIAISIVTTLLEDDVNGAERAQLMLESILELGTLPIERLVDRICSDCGCACASVPVRRKADGDYSIGPKYCEHEETCAVNKFLGDYRSELGVIADALKDIGSNARTKELSSISDLVSKFDLTGNARACNPCLTVGDLLIALSCHAVGISNLYTKNTKEFGPLCDALGLRAYIRPNQADAEDYWLGESS